ncbi:hypothetical protein E2C01_031329 [Portunus trituberculatus]|uniref:Uncharacterized protein n=1 Tax=Portunus trituberculatus TaxID=210409 RepID=A0A5B7EWJ6_PORTR|nr:hypothetical protein [Portunus trituberculatus]
MEIITLRLCWGCGRIGALWETESKSKMDDRKHIEPDGQNTTLEKGTLTGIGKWAEKSSGDVKKKKKND